MNDPEKSDHARAATWAWLTAALCAAVFSWAATMARPFTMDSPTKNQYNVLASQFLSGTVAMPESIPKELYSLKNPFDPNERKKRGLYSPKPRAWDRSASFADGKMYLYFGPLPAVFFAVYTAATGWTFPGEVWNLICALGVLFFHTALLLEVRKDLPRSPAWICSIAVLVASLSSGLVHEIREKEVYQNSLYGGALFASMSLYFAYTSMSRTSAWRVGTSFLALSAAYACRVTTLMWGIAPFTSAAYFICRSSPRKRTLLIVALVPTMLLLSLMGAYNQIRWGNPLETGFTSQITARDNHESILEFKNQPAHAAFNAYAFFWKPPVWKGFPDFWQQGGLDAAKPESVDWYERAVGVFPCYPGILLALLCLVGFRERPPRFKIWLVSCILSIFAVVMFLLVTKLVTFRYSMDLTAQAAVLAGIGVLTVAGTPVWGKIAACAATLFSVWSLSVSIPLANAGAMGNNRLEKYMRAADFAWLAKDHLLEILPVVVFGCWLVLFSIWIKVRLKKAPDSNPR